MRHKHLLGILAVVVLLLAVWLVPMALAAAGGPTGQASPDQTATGQASQAPSGTECPFLQAHPWLDPHGSGTGAGSAGATGTSQEIKYY